MGAIMIIKAINSTKTDYALTDLDCPDYTLKAESTTDLLEFNTLPEILASEQLPLLVNDGSIVMENTTGLLNKSNSLLLLNQLTEYDLTLVFEKK